MCIWDILGGGRLLARLDNHQKTVTCLRVAAHAGPASSAAPRLLTGSLDTHVKVRSAAGSKSLREGASESWFNAAWLCGEVLPCRAQAC